MVKSRNRVSETLRYALRYAARGWQVFPCAGKRPLTSHGLKDATTDADLIRTWWERWPQANVAIRTGSASALAVLDLDRRGDHDGVEVARAHGWDPADAGPVARTGGGGLHAYYRMPEGLRSGPIAPGVDVKAEGGYVIAPPSRTRGPYVWEADPDIEDLPPWPTEVIERVRAAWDTRAGDAEDVEGVIREGRRNTALTRLAGAMRRVGMGPESIAAALRVENAQRCKPPLPDDEVVRIAASVARYEPDQVQVAVVEGWAEEVLDSNEPLCEPVLINIGEVEPRPIRWLWPGRIALGKLTILAGDPGLGKSFLMLDMAARVSRGAAWPGPDAPNPNGPGGTVLLSAEDDVADTIRPRLDAAGAQVDRVTFLSAVRRRDPAGRKADGFFDLTQDLEALETAVQRTPECRLVVIDPISAYLGGTDSHNNAEVRALLMPLSDLAARYGVAVVAVTHLRKGSGKAIYRAMGSLAFTAAARAAYVVARDPDDEAGGRRLFLPIKNNLGPDTTGLAYRLDGEFSSTPIVVWEEQPVSVSADEALHEPEKRPGPEPTERNEAVEWLREMLADGPRVAREIIAEAKEAGISKRTLDRAKRPAGVVSEKLQNGQWVWKLEDCQVLPGANN